MVTGGATGQHYNATGYTGDGISLNVTARGVGEGTDPPGKMSIRSTGFSRNALCPLTPDSNDLVPYVAWYQLFLVFTECRHNIHIVPHVAEFEKLGTYVVDYTLLSQTFSPKLATAILMIDTR